MSTTNVQRLKSIRSAVIYVDVGSPSKFADLFDEGKRTRAAAAHLDAESPAQFVAFAEQMATKKKRTVEGISIIQSFRKEDIDRDDPEAVQRANDLGYELARSLFPASPRYVVTHTDSEGGYVHNHILVANHDFETGRAVSAQAKHTIVSRHNDRVMKEHGIDRVVPAWELAKGAKEAGREGLAMEIMERSSVGYWEQRRAGMELTPFYDALHEKISEAYLDPSSVDMDSFEAALASRGVTVTKKEHTIPPKKGSGNEPTVSVGLTYHMLDETGETGKKPRMRRRAAAHLDDAFKHKELEQYFNEKQQQRELMKEKGHGKDANETAVGTAVGTAEASPHRGDSDRDLLAAVEAQREDFDKFQSLGAGHFFKDVSSGRDGFGNSERDGVEEGASSSGAVESSGRRESPDAGLRDGQSRGSSQAQRDDHGRSGEPSAQEGSARSDADSGRSGGRSGDSSTAKRKRNERAGAAARQAAQREAGTAASKSQRGAPQNGGKHNETVEQRLARLTASTKSSSRGKDHGLEL